MSEGRDNPCNSVARIHGLGNTVFRGGRTGAYDGEAGSGGLRLSSVSDIAGGSGRRDPAAGIDRPSDPGKGARQAGSRAQIRSDGDDGADGGQDIGADGAARQFQAWLKPRLAGQSKRLGAFGLSG